MDQQRWQQVEDIVDTALSMEPLERKGYIKKICRGDKELKKNVTELLNNIEQAGIEDYLEEKEKYREFEADLADSTDQFSGESLAGREIGAYQIMELIGHGGMGSVYMAERSDELHREQVALKILPRGMDTPSNIARFRREQKILAKLDHPHIARLLDGGVTDDGRPFLVMEYVDGMPLIDYCDKHELTVSERLDLFESVCRAVQHAHRNTVIHRDLKPSNILVTKDQAVKVLDFGIAKLLKPENPEKTIFQTRTGARMFTLGYAAPEQVEGETVTITTDTYGLAVLLYELLAGVHPFDLKDKKLTEIEQLVRKQIPPDPSDRFRKLSNEKKERIAKARNTTPPVLADQLQGDLDAIIMKALRKEPGARYPSAQQLLVDLERRKHNLPIIAREDTFQYKASKFIRRYKTGLSTAAGIMLIIAGIVFYYSWQLNQQRNQARQEAQEARQISDFLLNLYETISQEETVTVHELLQQGVQETNSLKDEPVYPTMLSVMGRAYSNFGDYEKALSLHKKALKKTQEKHGINSREYATALNSIGLVHLRNYDSELALPYFRKTYQLRSDLLGEKHIKTANTIMNLGRTLRNVGKLDSAELYARKASEINNKLLSPDDPELLRSMTELAYVLRKQQDYQEAESLYLKTISKTEERDDQSPTLSTNYNNLAYLYRDQQQFKKAIQYYKKALQIYEQEYTQGHPEILNTRRNLATSQYFEGHYEEAVSSFKKNLAATRQKFSTEHWRTASQLNMLGLLLLSIEQYGKAEPYVRESAQIHRKVFGKDDLRTAYSEGLLTANLKMQGKNKAEADSLYQHHYQLFKENASEFNGENRNNVNRLIDIYQKNGEGDSLITAYEKLTN